MNDYEAKQEARRERMLERAAKAERDSSAAFNHADRLVENIPPGQPILVGHHSEAGHRRTLDRSHRAMDRGCSELKKAAHYRGKAAGVGHGGISADDPDAVTKLRAKLKQKQGARDGAKKLTKAFRLAVKAGVNDGKPLGQGGEPTNSAELPAELVAQVAAKVGLKIPDDEKHLRAIMAWHPPYSFVKSPFFFTNMGAEIRRLEKRIAELGQVAEQRAKVREALDAEGHDSEPGPSVQVGAVKIVSDYEANRLRVYFPDKPSSDIRRQLKSHGFRWSPSEGAWQRQLGNAYAAHMAQEIAEKYQATA